MLEAADMNNLKTHHIYSYLFFLLLPGYLHDWPHRIPIFLLLLCMTNRVLHTDTNPRQMNKKKNTKSDFIYIKMSSD